MKPKKYKWQKEHFNKIKLALKILTIQKIKMLLKKYNSWKN